jgi:hypothetical protein
MSCTPVLNFVRVEASRGAQLLEFVCRSYSEFGQVMTLAEQQAVVEIASGGATGQSLADSQQGRIDRIFHLILNFQLAIWQRSSA